MRGCLEGLESSYGSPGLGLQDVTFGQLPKVGTVFWWYTKQGLFYTGTVKSLDQLPNEVRFRTKRTTYILKVWED
jgi:hypothetical protein